MPFTERSGKALPACPLDHNPAKMLNTNTEGHAIHRGTYPVRPALLQGHLQVQRCCLQADHKLLKLPRRQSATAESVGPGAAHWQCEGMQIYLLVQPPASDPPYLDIQGCYLVPGVS